MLNSFILGLSCDKSKEFKKYYRAH